MELLHVPRIFMEAGGEEGGGGGRVVGAAANCFDGERGYSAPKSFKKLDVFSAISREQTEMKPGSLKRPYV